MSSFHMTTAHHRFAVAILALLVLPVPAWGADPIKAELYAAREVHADTVEAAREVLQKVIDDEFDDALKKIAAAGDLDGYKALLAKKSKASQLNLLPETHPLHKHQVAYMEVTFSARIPLASALDLAVKKYTMALKIDKATAAQRELQSLIQRISRTRIDAFQRLGAVFRFKDRVITSVAFPTNSTGGGLAYLEGLTKLKSLSLRLTQATDAGLVHLKGLRNLETLNLWKAIQITGAGLVHLRDLKMLINLNLHDTKVTDAGLINLKGLTNLKILELSHTKVTDTGLVHLKGMTKLEYLELGGTKVTDAGLAHLKGLTDLKSLFVRNTKVTDTGLVHLKGLTNLKILELYGTKVTDTGLAHLKGLTKLEILSLISTKVTDAGVKKLKQALPNCKISF